MEAILFAILACLGWGIGDIFGTIATRKLGSYSMSFWGFALRLVIFGLYIPFALAELSHITAEIVLLNLSLGVILLIGYLAFNEGLRIANPSLVGAISASFAAVAVILSIVFLHDTITPNQEFAILVIILGIILSILDFKELKKGVTANRGILLAIVSMVAWGVYFTFIKIPIRQVGWFWPGYISFTVFPLLPLFAKFKKIKLHGPTFQNSLFPLLCAVALTGIAEYSFNFAVSRGLTAVVAPIAGSYPALFVVLAFFVFKDPVTNQQKVGIATTLTGIVLLSIFSAA